MSVWSMFWFMMSGLVFGVVFLNVSVVVLNVGLFDLVVGVGGVNQLLIVGLMMDGLMFRQMVIWVIRILCSNLLSFLVFLVCCLIGL